MWSDLEDRFKQYGLSLANQKSQWVSSVDDPDQQYNEITQNPSWKPLQVLGIAVAKEGGSKHQIDKNIRGAWSSFSTVQKALRQTNYPMSVKANIINKLNGGKITYGLSCFYIGKEQLLQIDSVQKAM